MGRVGPPSGLAASAYSLAQKILQRLKISAPGVRTVFGRLVDVYIYIRLKLKKIGHGVRTGRGYILEAPAKDPTLSHVASPKRTPTRIVALTTGRIALIDAPIMPTVKISPPNDECATKQNQH